MYIGKNASPKEGLLQVSVMSGGVGESSLFCRHADGKYFIIGEPGVRFSVQLRNVSQDGRRMEVVVAVDGSDVISGKECSLNASGLILEPGYEITLGAWGSADGWLEFAKFASSQDFSQPQTGIISVAAFLEDHPSAVRLRGSSPDFEPSEEVSGMEPRSSHTAYALPIPTGVGPGFATNLRPRQFARSPHRSPLVINIGYGETHALNQLGVLEHAEPRGFDS